MGLLKDGFYPEIQGDIAAGRVTTIEQVNLALEAWLHYVNHRRHRETKLVPAEAYGSRPRHPFADPLRLDEIFLWRKTIRVDKFGTVSLEGNRYTAGADLRGQRVELRYDPLDLARVRLWVDGQFRAGRCFVWVRNRCEMLQNPGAGLRVQPFAINPVKKTVKA